MSHPKNTAPATNVGVDKSQTNIRQLSPYFVSGVKSGGDNPRTTSEVDTIVLHWTGGSTADDAVRTLYGNVNSYHFIIEKDGTIIQCKPILERANHAGHSYGPNGLDVNYSSIGISFVTVGGLKKENLIEGDQLQSGINLIADIHAALKNDDKKEGGIKWFTSHHQISPVRKQDPYSLEPDMVSGKNIQSQLRELLKNNITYWRAGMGPKWPKGLHKDCKCAKLKPPLKESSTLIDGPDGKVSWCKLASDESKCYQKGHSSYKYTFNAMSVYIKGELSKNGLDESEVSGLFSDVTTDEKGGNT